MNTQLNSLKYHEVAEKGNRIYDKILRVLEFTSSDNQEIIKLFEKNSTYFSNNLRNIFKNAIALSAQCDFNPKLINNIAKYINKGIENFAIYGDIKSIQHFLFRKAEVINTDVLKQFLFSAISNGHFHDVYLFESFSNIINSSKKYLELTKKEFNDVLNFILPKCEKCGREHSDVYLVYFFRIIDNQKQRELIKSKIDSSLSKSFDNDLFTYSIIFDIIPFNLIYFDSLLDSVKPKIESVDKLIGRPFIDSNSPNTNYDLDFFLNICFKENVDLSSEKYKVFFGINFYYDWLLNMNDFDYSHFDPKWITVYGTRFYFKVMSESKVLKQKLEEFIQSKESYSEQNVLNDYLNIYVRRSWENKL